MADQGYSCVEAGRSLGVRGNLVGRWRREFESGDVVFQGHGKLTPVQQWIRDLEAEVRCLKMEKDILIKATTFLVQEYREISIYRDAHEGLAGHAMRTVTNV